MVIVNVERKLFFNHRNSHIQPDTHLNYELKRPIVKNEKENLQENQRLLLHSQHKEKKNWKCSAFDCATIPSSFWDKIFPLAFATLCVCRHLFDRFLSHNAGLGRGRGPGGFGNGVGGLCFAARSSKSCLSVLSSWTSCNNTNGPLNRLLCCADG